MADIQVGQRESQLHARVSQEALSKLSRMAPHRRKGEFIDWLIRKEYHKREKRGVLVPTITDSACTELSAMQD